MANISEDNVNKAIDKIRPMLQADGGNIELIKIEGKKVFVKLQGACVGCPMAPITLKQGVEATLKEDVDPNITVEQVL